MITRLQLTKPVPHSLNSTLLMSAGPQRRAFGRALVSCAMIAASALLPTYAQPQSSPATASTAATTAASLANWSQQVREFAGTFAADPEIPTAWAMQVLGQAQYNKRVKRLMTPAPGTTSTVRDWQAYQARLVSAARIESGVQFWRRNRATLADVEAQWGVPASVIVGIIGIETSYGQNMGNIRVLDALATLAFDYPTEHPRATERAAYFRKELEEFLRLCHTNGLDPLAVTGSFAGAMGIPQFMPSNWTLYGEDYNRSGAVNLISSTDDAIASVANYLRAHGWRPNQPAYFEVDLQQTTPEQMRTLLAPDILPSFDMVGLTALGVSLLPAKQQYDGQMALVELKNGENPPEYVIGTENFYAVTRYNQSSYYALAVLKLGEAVEQRLKALQLPVTPAATAPSAAAAPTPTPQASTPNNE
ncbi:lytic murein transglycosylase B [Lampropedia aestuarii]|uniref:lytic murein transglycosylase B n=1 Tax=Lampropedia aestuarii TaxID=2562762 RepID=UPI002469B6CF|nr:lytic murein transglycosylase B [Lampropedia aestuarii]MDH5858086.1 lytic murein transglycosylase B [Lampropedia aestuarii]